MLLRQSRTLLRHCCWCGRSLRQLRSAILASDECSLYQQNVWSVSLDYTNELHRLDIRQQNEKQVPSVRITDGYPHMPIQRPLAARRFVRFWASGKESSRKYICHSLPRAPMNHREKFDAAMGRLLIYIRGAAAEKSVTVQTNKNTQKTVNDISTPCQSACVDNEETVRRLAERMSSFVYRFSDNT